MNIEYEATFTEINKDAMREKLRAVGAELVRSEFEQKRAVFNLPAGHERKGAWMRVRDEGDKITMTFKQVGGAGIEDQKEIETVVADFDAACGIVEVIGCERKAFQVTRRELWRLDGVEVTLDEWPFLAPIVEVEGASEKRVRAVSEKLGFDWNDAKFCAADTLYAERYGVTEDRVNNHTQRLDFEMEKPFVSFV